MRERTPSADDNPKRAPLAPLKEAASADVTGSKTSTEPAEAHHRSKFSSVTTASLTTSVSSPPSSVDTRMVASTHNLDELSVSHPTNTSNDRQQQEKHGHAYRSAQTAQDKRSRLSNVINNLRKKVPDSVNGDSPRKEEDDRNSVERNLETLEKYVMTVLNGVIKDEEDDDKEAGKTKEEKRKESDKLTDDQEDEDSKGVASKFEPSKPNESRTEAVVFSSKQLEKLETKEVYSGHRKLETRELDVFQKEDKKGSCESKEVADGVREENDAFKVEVVEEEFCKNKCSFGDTNPENESSQEATKADVQEKEKKENRSLGTIIMERLSEHDSGEDSETVETVKKDTKQFVNENVELRTICRDLLNDLLNDINQLIDRNSQAKEETNQLDTLSDMSRDTRNHDLPTTSLHCSLPLDKVASVLQNCQTSELIDLQSPSSSSSSSSSFQGSKSPSKPTSPTVRHLCLYCDRKFLSISLRQRHTERVHQQGGGRRSDRNTKKPLQNCQYCLDKCAESLEDLFQHMVGSHGDKYHACVQCSTRYMTRETLTCHMNENHGIHAERTLQTQEKMKEFSPCKEFGNQSPRDRPLSAKERGAEESNHDHRAETTLLKPMINAKDNFSNPGSPEFDSSFYSSVSCNIRENLLHHLDGKLQSTSSTVALTTSTIVESKHHFQQQQTFYEYNANQIQFPIDISLTAATPVYSKEYINEEYENNSEYAQKPGKTNRSHPRRVSFEKYNFPRKYDGKEQWTCSIKDLSKFDISTQLSLRKKQQLLKERLTLTRLNQISVPNPSEITDIAQVEENLDSGKSGKPEPKSDMEASTGAHNECTTECKLGGIKAMPPQGTEFSTEFGNFLRLRKWTEKMSNDAVKKQDVVYAELTGEWSRPRIYICGACATKHVTLKEMEDHKAISHPNVWCSHFEFSGDQRELYKHLFLPGRDIPTAKAKAAFLVEKICTKCSKNCSTLSELHRHMLECGGDQAWLLGLFGNGKKKCKWRPFGSRSRRRRQRGMKRNIQNSQTPRMTVSKEKQPTGPRVRPSDRESIQKMLANLPPKRATRKVLQDSTMRAQGRLRNVQTRTRPRIVGDNSSASRMSRNKAVLRNKLLKNAKSIQRNRCRIDNISAVIESVVKNYHPDSRIADSDIAIVERNGADKEAKEKSVEESSRNAEVIDETDTGNKVGKGPRALGKKRNVKTKDGTLKNLDEAKKTGSLKSKTKGSHKNLLEAKPDGSSDPVKAPKGVKVSLKHTEKESEGGGTEARPTGAKSPGLLAKNKFSVQSTPKRKRPVDPVASLNASIKAKSQLRTQDGKFAKNPNKDQSPAKSSENKFPLLGRQLSKEKVSDSNSSLSVSKCKLRTMSKNKNGDQLPKRTTRLSSDSDKMPTLEPVVQIPANNEEYIDATAIDLPILSPVTSSSGSEKLFRGKNVVDRSTCSDGKGGVKKGNEDEEAEGKIEVKAKIQAENRDQKQIKGRKAKNLDKKPEYVGVKTETSKEAIKGVVKEKLKRKSAPARILNVEGKKLSTKTAEGTTKILDSKSASKIKMNKTVDDNEPIKIESVPFEVKKLIGSDNKEDLLSKLVLTSMTISKRCLRQPMSKVKTGQTKSKTDKNLQLEKKVDSGSMSDASTKQEKFEARRKSSRNTERNKTQDDKLEQGNKICETVNEIKAAIRGRRSSSLSNDSKSTLNTSQVASTNNQIKTDIEFSVQTSDKRQTRGSLINNFSEEQCEPDKVYPKKATSMERRRGRVRSNNDKKLDALRTVNKEADKSNATESTNISSNDQNSSLTVGNVDENKQEGNDVVKNELLKCSASEIKEADKANLNMKHQQVETSNFVESGKENVVEVTAPVQKLKVGRPRKSWGTKRERTSKRSLNNVIGILTEGMNTSAETQHSVPLVQSIVDNASSNETLQSNTQQSNSATEILNADKPVESFEESQTQPTEEIGVLIQNSKGESHQPEASNISNKEETSFKDTTVQSPTDDILLDLARRKQKGKGSFLEKIVSKIAKQKDALLEGEVGSLLDTAADELTSILDEVGPSLSEVIENTVETENIKVEAESKVQGSEQEMVKESDNCSDYISLTSKCTNAECKDQSLKTSDPALKQSQAEQLTNNENSDSLSKINSFRSIDDQAVSSLDLAEKPPSQCSPINNLKLNMNECQTQKMERFSKLLEDSVDQFKPKEKLKQKNSEHSSSTNTLTENQRCSDKQTTQTVFEEDCETIVPKMITKNSNEDTKLSLECENRTVISPLEDDGNKELNTVVTTKTTNTNQKSSNSDCQSLNEKVSEIHQYSSNENHRMSKGKKTSVKNKTIDLASETRDSENKYKSELQNKSKVVKHVFGQVFDGEKTDNMERGLNSWVSKSEDNSVILKAEFRSSSPNERNLEEISENKNEDNNTKGNSVTSFVSSDTKMKVRKKSKEHSFNRIEEQNSMTENQKELHSTKNTKSKNNSSNRNKPEEDSNSDHFLILPPNKSRHSKKLAEERISKSIFPKIENKDINYELRSQSKSDSTIKDNDRGSVGCNEDTLKVISSKDFLEQEHILMKRAYFGNLKSQDTNPEHKETALRDPPEEICSEVDNSYRKGTEDEFIAFTNKKIIDRKVEFNQLNPKKINVCESDVEQVKNILTEVYLGKPEEKNNQNMVSEGTKVKMKSKKRSLEGSSPKKSKRKSVEPVDSAEESLIPDELDLADIIKLIDGPERTPSTEQKCIEGRIHCSKRKTFNVDLELKDSNNKVQAHNTEITDETTEVIKKPKIDSKQCMEECKTTNKKNKIELETEETKNSVKDKVNDEEKDSSSLRITGKRKSYIESMNCSQESDSPVRRCSKRKTAQEAMDDTLFILDYNEATESAASTTASEITRRRSSRMKFMVKLKNTDKDQKNIENDSTIVNDVKNFVEECPSSILLGAVERSKIAEETDLKVTENQQQSTDDTVENLPQTNLNELENLVASTVLTRVPKKRGRKKKCPNNVDTQINHKAEQENSGFQLKTQTVDSDLVAVDQTSRRSLRISRLNEELEEQNKNSSDTATSKTTYSSLEPFKIPEVSEVLQHTKRRTFKRRSATDEHLDSQNNLCSAEFETNNSKWSEMDKRLIEKEDQQQNQKDFLQGRQRFSRNSHHLGLERSSSSGSINVIQASKKKSSKKKQLSSEDLSGQESLNHKAESVDSLSETSCTSESSYFRKKRFSKKKKEFQAPPEDAQTDTSMTDSESVDTERTTDRRQSLKRRAKENISFEDPTFDLVDYFDIPMDIQDTILREDVTENSVSQELDSESSTTKESAHEATTNNVSFRESEEDDTNEDETMDNFKKSDADEEEQLKGTDKTNDKPDELVQSQDFQTPKKRAAGNFVVVHKKTGEILIVEKRKKLTKEAARFFCNVCATSFTRKSSLKKHNQSQSHLLQVAKFKRDKGSIGSRENIKKDYNASQNEVSSDENRSITNEENILQLSEKSQNEDFLDSLNDHNDLQPGEDESASYTETVEQEFLMESQIAQQRILEDELLDEEICKITENMSHDEYVLTDHVSPAPESTSTPIKMDIEKEEEIGTKKRHKRKKEKIKKNLIGEQTTLDSSETETPIDSSMMTVVGTSTSTKISRSSNLNISELGDTNTEDCDFHEECSKDTYVCKLHKSQDVQDSIKFTKNKDLEQKIEEPRQIGYSKNNVYELNLDTTLKNSKDAHVLSNNRDSSKERHLNEHLSLKLTINKLSTESCKKRDTRNDFQLDHLNTFSKEDDERSENLMNSFKHSIEEMNNLKSEIEQLDLEAYLGSTKKTGSGRNTENTGDFDTFNERNIEYFTAQQNAVNIENTNQKQNESTEEARHDNSKRNKGKKHVDQAQNITDTVLHSNDIVNKKSSKFKNNQGKQTFSETVNNQKAINNSEIFECNNENMELSIYNLQLERKYVQENNTINCSKADTEAEKTVFEQLIAEQQTNNKSTDSANRISCFHSIDDDEVSSSSSLADKPLSQLLLITNMKVGTAKKQVQEREPSSELLTMDYLDDKLGSERSLKEKNVEDCRPHTNMLIDNQKCYNKDATNCKEVKPQIVSEERYEAGISKMVVEDSDKQSKTLLVLESSEAIPSLKNVSNKESHKVIEAKTGNSNQKVSSNDRQGLNRNILKSHKYSSSESHRKTKGNKTSVRNRIADLTSESENSETEEKSKLQNKSKIVKSVFGRVFSGERTDKVKEVLNDWVSKSEDDSDMSKAEFISTSPNVTNVEEVLKARNEEKNIKRHSNTSFVASGTKKKPGNKFKESSSSDKTKENPLSDSQEELRSKKNTKSKNSSNNRKKLEEDASDYYFLVLPPNKSRHSKKIAEERISKAFDGVRLCEEFLDDEDKETNYELRSQSKPDLTFKDSGYGSFNYDEDSSKMVCLDEAVEKDHKLSKKQKSSSTRSSKCKTDNEDWKDLVTEMKTLRNTKEPTDEEDISMKDLPEEESVAKKSPTDLKTRSCSSLASSNIRNRSPSIDRNSQSTKNSDMDEEDEDIAHKRISPLFVHRTPRNLIESNPSSENEEDENVVDNKCVMRKRSSSEFSGEKIIIRSPSSTRKHEMVTIAPTDAIEDNALDVPQEIETVKPRQGKVLNFDEELFVECCSRLKATTENELRGAKKIKLDHNESYHRKDDQLQEIREPRDRWRDVESQNSLGSLLESVNQLLGEEMYSTKKRDYPKRGSRSVRSEHSSRSASPDISRADNLGYEDSLDVAFEHNIKLRDKIQQRMRESENLIASTFGKSSNNIDNAYHPKIDEQDLRSSYSHLQDQGHLFGASPSNGSYNDTLYIKSLQEHQSTTKMILHSGFKNKMNSSLGGLLDKALSNLLHSNGKHDHNASTPMKVLAELACARAPTATMEVSTSEEVVQAAKTSSLNEDSICNPCSLTPSKDIQKKPRNSIKELFERKKEIIDKKQHEKSKTEAALRELNARHQHKTKKIKKHQEFPLIRCDERGGLAERKKRRDGLERKEDFVSNRKKDVYDFDEDESQMEPNLGSVMSYRNRSGYEVNYLKTKDIDVAGLISTAIDDSLQKAKTGDALSSRLESMIDRKFKELEKFAPKTKGALKAFQSEDQRQITGPMDEFVERKQLKSKRLMEQSLKHSKLKKRSKNPKKKTRNAWYENDSSDEYRTAVKTDDIGVGISKSQRTCSKGKQNIFAELYTSSESELEYEDVNYETKRQQKVKRNTKKIMEAENQEQGQEIINKYSSENEIQVDNLRDENLKNSPTKQDFDNKKSESEMSDHPLVIDERKDLDDQRNSDDETENHYERNYEMDDLYREDSSIVDSDIEDSINKEVQNVLEQSRVTNSALLQEEANDKASCVQENELIPLEEALDLLDWANNETSLETKYSNVNRNVKPLGHMNMAISTELVNETFNPVEESTVKYPRPIEEQEEEPDNDLLSLPEKLSSNEKPQKESENLPLHVFLSRKVQESKKRKEQQLKKMQQEQERILLDFQPTRRQRKCAIGKQGLLAEISSSDEELSSRAKKTNDKLDHDKPRKQKRESKEKRKERYIEKKHEQMIAKEQKAIEEEILREVGKKKDSLVQNTQDPKTDLNDTQETENIESGDDRVNQEAVPKKKHQMKEKQKKLNKVDEEVSIKDHNKSLVVPENNCNSSILSESNYENENNQESSVKQKKHSKSLSKLRKISKGDAMKVTVNKKTIKVNSDKSKNRIDSKASKDKERRSSNSKHDSDDEELKTTKSWNKVEEGVGVAIGRRKRAAANQLYYWSSSSDEEEVLEVVPIVEEEENERQEQHGWIVGDSHKRMITMLAMEKQLKEKRRRSEDEFEPGRAKSKKHRNSTS